MSELFLETKNNMGYQANKLDPISEAYVHQAVSDSNGNYIDIGAAYGVATSEILKEREATVYCNDICSEHLEELSHDSRVKCIYGDFMTADIPEAFFDGALCSRLLHFYGKDKAISTLKAISHCLKQGGKLFLTTETPFLGNWKAYLKIFHQKKQSGEKWPGYVDNVYEIESTGRSGILPNNMHFFDIDTLVYALNESGFSVDRVEYINRSNTFPDDLLLDGRESVGAIARKIR